jgi:hypothetical protein
MHMPDSTKPKKPRKDLPVRLHAKGSYIWRHQGKDYYLGSDPELAIEEYLRINESVRAGKGLPTVDADGLTLLELVERFDEAKLRRVKTGELSEATYRDYEKAAKRLLAATDGYRIVEQMRPTDFDEIRSKLAIGLSPVSLGNLIQRCRVIFKWGWDSGLLDKPARFGVSFSKPSKRAVRTHRNEHELKHGLKMWEPAEIKTLLESANVHMAAMIHLALNCAFEPHDLQKLPLSVLPDLRRTESYLAFPRPKTAMPRRAWLWPETRKAITASRKARPKSKTDDAKALLFITKYGHAWGNGINHFPISQEFRKLSIETDTYRKGVGFLGFRHAFATIAGDTGDQIAVDTVMGHVPAADDMRAVYRRSVSDERIKAVCEAVRDWLG